MLKKSKTKKKEKGTDEKVEFEIESFGTRENTLVKAILTNLSGPNLVENQKILEIEPLDHI